MSPSLPRAEKYYLLKQEIEEFLYEEAELLDQRRFREWLDRLTDDLVYVMPIRRNVKVGQQAERRIRAPARAFLGSTRTSGPFPRG